VQVSRFGIVVGLLALPMGFVVRIGLESGWLACRITIATEILAIFGVVQPAMMELTPFDRFHLILGTTIRMLLRRVVGSSGLG